MKIYDYLVLEGIDFSELSTAVEERCESGWRIHSIRTKAQTITGSYVDVLLEKKETV